MNARKIYLITCMSDIVLSADNGSRNIAQARSLKFTSTDGKAYVNIFLTPVAAAREAERLAKLEPTKIFVVLESVRYFETTVPNVIEKEINDRGEFVLKAEAKRATPV